MKIVIEMKFFDGRYETYSMNKAKFVIGRSKTADLVLDADGFSREHCLIEYTDEGFFITDLNSTNGVRINGEQIEKNKRTSYDTFFPLSIGYAESVTLFAENIDQIAETSNQPLENIARDRVSNPKIKVAPKTDKSRKIETKKEATKAKKKTKSNDKNVFLLKMVFILIATGFVLYFLVENFEF